MSELEGKISIRIADDPDLGRRAVVGSTRPVLASKVFIGKSPRQALNLVPLMFNICGNAQARTAVSAIGSAIGGEPDPRLELARDMLVLVENAREHLFRIFVDWPRLFDVEIDNRAVHPLGSMIPQFRQALFHEGQAFTLDSRLEPDFKTLGALVEGLEFQLGEYVLLGSTGQWLSMRSNTDLDAWMNDCDSVAAVCTRDIVDQGWSAEGAAHCSDLPRIDPAELAGRLDGDDADDFIARPDWRGQQHESTPYSRQASHPLVASLTDEFGPALLPRWMARLVELASIPGQLKALLQQLQQQDAVTRGSSTSDGIAITEAARGRLIHRVRIDRDEISTYQILAPTEWNFHPEGLISNALANLKEAESDRLEKLVHLVVNTIDPCVGYDLEIAS